MISSHLLDGPSLQAVPQPPLNDHIYMEAIIELTP